jgi:hypothetical protein
VRDNGLTASTYTSMGGIDPLVTEPVLAALAEAGIAAYTTEPGEKAPAEAPAERAAEQPGEDTSDTSATAELPARADIPARAEIPAGREEIFVDAGSADRARAVIDRSTEDAEWKSLVEQFNAPSVPGGQDGTQPRWPTIEDLDETDKPIEVVTSGRIVPDVTDEDEPHSEERSNDPHEHYIPPEPPRGPRLDWISRAAWLGLIGGPVLLVLAALFDFGASRITLIAVLGFSAGFLTLVIRMKERPPDDDSSDDGAVI